MWIFREKSAFYTLMRYGWAIAGIFALAGFGLSSWLSRLSDFAETFSLDAGTIGLVLMVQELCGLLAMQMVSVQISRRGHLRFTLYSLVLYGIGACMPGAAFNPLTLGLAMLFLGSGYGALDIAMNSRADAIEKHYQVRVMGYAHAFFSLGGLLGALLAAFFADTPIPLALHFMLVGGVIMAMGVTLWKQLPIVPLQTRQARFFLSLPNRTLWPLCLIAVAVTIVEGGMASWAGLYVRRELGGDATTAALCYGVFSAGMFLGRLVSDPIIARCGSPRLMRYSSLLAAAAFSLFLLAPGIPLALAGLFGCGAGIACSWPIFIRAAAHTRGNVPAHNMAAVVTCAYLGFLASPVIIGFAADQIGLRNVLWVVVLACLVLAVMAPKTYRADMLRTD